MEKYGMDSVKKIIITLCSIYAVTSFAAYEPVTAGGFGGNEKIGRFVYDGRKLPLHFSKLDILRDTENKICLMQNYDVTVRVINSKEHDPVAQFPCPTVHPDYHFYWDANLESKNGAYSPANDAIALGVLVNNMYKDWYNTPALTEIVDGETRQKNIVMRLHEWGGVIAFWDGEAVTFDDGDQDIYFPPVTLSVTAHEISHGFTQQHSHLNYDGQSGALNESFSDMASKAAEYYFYGKINDWKLGADFLRADRAFRYMDNPRRDCVDNMTNKVCSIDNAKDYSSALNVHLTSGVFNKLFYLLAVSPGWDTRMAFNIMVQANESYWTANSTFQQAACGLMNATQDYGYDTAVVTKACSEVGIDTKKCDQDV
jgi:pseudolysin